MAESRSTPNDTVGLFSPNNYKEAHMTDVTFIQGGCKTSLDIAIYTNGSFQKKTGVGSYCCMLIDEGLQKTVLVGAETHTTLERMELKALVEGLRVLRGHRCDLEIVTSETIASIIKNYLTEDFKWEQNADLWQEYMELSKPHKIHIVPINKHYDDDFLKSCIDLSREHALLLNKQGASL